MLFNLVLVSVLVLLGGGQLPVSNAAGLPDGFRQEVLLTNLPRVLVVAFLPDNRMIYSEKKGTFNIVDVSVRPVQSSPYMSIPNVNYFRERGVLGFVLDPDFATNHFFYVSFTGPKNMRVSRFTHAENAGGLTSRGLLASEVVLYNDPAALVDCCHYGGSLTIGPDGCLYLTTGDQSSADVAQDLSQSGGKVIRLFTNGSIPSDNFGLQRDGVGGTILDQIWAYGLRNPFKAFWDLPTRRYFIAEVGGNVQQTAWEDLHLGANGKNFGWPNCEGPCNNIDYASTCDCNVDDNPIYSYKHSNKPASIIGGFVYRGSMFPSSYVGTYFFGDFTRHFIKYLTFDATTGTSFTSEVMFQPLAESVLTLALGKDGAIYYTTDEGNLWCIKYDR